MLGILAQSVRLNRLSLKVHFWPALLALLTSTTVASVAVAAEVALDEPLQLTWNVPPECPSAADVRSDVRGLLSQKNTRALEFASTAIVVDATIRLKGEGSYLLVLRANEQSRTLEGSSCTELAQAAALLMALLLNPGLSQSDPGTVPSGSRNSEPEPKVENARATSPTVGHAEPTQSGLSTKIETKQPTVGLFEVAGRVEIGRFPHVEPGLSTAIGLERAAFRILMRGALSAPQDLDVPSGGKVKLLPISVSLEPAYRLVRRGWGLEGGLGIELGITHSRATEFEPKERFVTSVSGLTQLRGTRNLTHWLRGWLGLTAAIPVLRPRWVTRDGELVYTYGTALRGELGLQMLF